MSLPEDTFTHKFVHVLEHIWPYVSGMVIVMFAGFKLWWSDRRETKVRIKNIEVMVEHLQNDKVSQQDLQACRDDVREVDDANLVRIMDRIEQNATDNAKQHQDILQQIIRLHAND